WWNAGYTGQGIDVAEIDSGVSPVQGLDAPGKIVYGPDLSLESQAPNLTNLDTYGHGTFMAGLIAGDDGATGSAAYRGVAPGARDSMGTTSTADDVPATFSASSQCKTCRIPDILAPGAHLQGLRVPNSYIDANYPEGIIDQRFFRGSGTSEAAAFVSGAVALV